MSGTVVDFRARFIAALPPIPPDFDLHLDAFVEFDEQLLHSHGLDPDDIGRLVSPGLPRDASPFLTFNAYSKDEVSNRKEIFGIPEAFFPIGHNGSGDVVAINSVTREVVYFNHDNHNQLVLINSSLRQFTESLCIFQEALTGGAMASCIAAIGSIDSPANMPGSMWHAEVMSDLADEV